MVHRLRAWSNVSSWRSDLHEFYDIDSNMHKYVLPHITNPAINTLVGEDNPLSLSSNFWSVYLPISPTPKSIGLSEKTIHAVL